MPQTPHKLAREIRKKISVEYLLFVPEAARSGTATPLLLFLHGAGERGTDLKRVAIHGPPSLLDEKPDFPFIVVSPQCPANSWWQVDVLTALLDAIEAEHPVDRRRVYVTGLSMGGFGTWDLAIAHPERFAAIAPICGGGRPYLADRLKHTPVWAFHGGKDPVVPLSESERMVKAVQSVGGMARLTVYPDAGHDSWSETYRNPKLYDWFLSHRLHG